ncbi:MAG: class II fumarate hydratase [Bryobacterales bacterium]|nr:class II fumarate hydratase [Bryobacterales bacterium]
MEQQQFRMEHDSLGEVAVPFDALYGAQTQRAVLNFPVSGQRFPRAFLEALGLVKAAAAKVNRELGVLNGAVAQAIESASEEVAAGGHDRHFPVDVFQTGSGTSTNMNANEVIATLASRRLGVPVHPNDHVNRGQSSNDVIPTVIHLSAALELTRRLLPALAHLGSTIERKSETLQNVVKNGRTHLMDAMPVLMSQELSGWQSQVVDSMTRLESVLPRLLRLAIGGTAVGTGVNTHPRFGAAVAARLASITGLPFITAPNYFAAISGMDTAVELSGHLKTAAAPLMKIANDLRWMNSGPLSGLGEISLPALQPGSSIMPGKVNPVIPEAVAMVCARVTGNDAAVTIAGQSGNFQLNVMLPLIAVSLLESIALLSASATLMADRAIQGFTVHGERLRALAERNPILATVLTAKTGYEKTAQIVKRAIDENRAIKDVAAEMSGMTEDELNTLLDPVKATSSGA